MLQRAAAGHGPVNAPPIVHQVLRSPGRPLDSGVRAFMEPHFGHSFGSVRIHTDAAAAESARSVNALAYTVGDHVVFDQGRYAPSTPEGRRTVAHELTHVIQQSGAGNRSLDRLTVSAPGDAHEREAEEKASAVTSGTSHSISSRAAMSVQRQTFGGPLDFKFDPCVTVPGLGTLCGQAAAKACTEHPEIPGCTLVCKLFDCPKPKEPAAVCPPGFKPATATDFLGQCCVVGKDGTFSQNAQNCCPPVRIPRNATSPRCCAAGELPDAEGKSCAVPSVPKLTACPPDYEASIYTCSCFPFSRQNLLKSTCCPVGQEGWSGVCKVPVAPPPPGPAPQPGPAPPGPIEIHFELDRPRSSDTGSAGLSSSLTSDGTTSLASLVLLLKQNTDWRVQLVGKASPEGKDAYNMDLGGRRARMVAQALQDGLGRSPVDAGPDAGLAKGCQTLDVGLFSCGKIGATGAGDRQVRALVFIPGKAAAP